MKKSYYIIFLCIFLLMLPIVYSTEPTFYYHINDNVNINVPCYNSGTYCSSAAVCNITILDPHANYFVSNKQLTNNIAYHNISINPIILGDYQAFIMCTDNNISNYDNFVFQVNNTGSKIENMLPMLIFYIILIIITLVLLIAAIDAESPMILPLILLLTLIFSWTFFYIYMHTISLNTIYYGIYWFFLIISVGIFFVILWLGTLMAISMFSKKEKRRQNLGDDF